MPFHKTFGIDLGTSTVKIYSQEQDTMITEKNMIATAPNINRWGKALSGAI